MRLGLGAGPRLGVDVVAVLLGERSLALDGSAVSDGETGVWAATLGSDAIMGTTSGDDGANEPTVAGGVVTGGGTSLVTLPPVLSAITATTGAATVLVRITGASTTVNGRVLSATDTVNRGFEVMSQSSQMVVRIGGSATVLNPARAYSFAGGDQLVGFRVDAGTLNLYTSSAGLGPDIDISGIGTFTTSPARLLMAAWAAPNAAYSFDSGIKQVSVWDRALTADDFDNAESGLNG